MTEEMLGRYLSLRAFCTCTETYAKFKDSVDPYPAAPETITALRDLNSHIVDPLIDHYGIERFRLVYGFCSNELRKKLIKQNPETQAPFGRVAPQLDQHMSLERKPNKAFYCKRPGAAFDFRIEGEDARSVLRWIIEAGLPFDRIYFYGPSRALHVSYGPENSRYICGFNEANVPDKRSVSDLVALAKERYS